MQASSASDAGLGAPASGLSWPSLGDSKEAAPKKKQRQLQQQQQPPPPPPDGSRPGGESRGARRDRNGRTLPLSTLSDSLSAAAAVRKGRPSSSQQAERRESAATAAAKEKVEPEDSVVQGVQQLEVEEGSRGVGTTQATAGEPGEEAAQPTPLRPASDKAIVLARGGGVSSRGGGRGGGAGRSRGPSEHGAASSTATTTFSSGGRGEGRARGRGGRGGSYGRGSGAASSGPPSEAGTGASSSYSSYVYVPSIFYPPAAYGVSPSMAGMPGSTPVAKLQVGRRAALLRVYCCGI